MRRRLLGRIAQTKETVRNAISGLTAGQVHSLPLAESQESGRGHVTVDPYVMARYYYGDYLDLTIEDVEPLEIGPTRET